MEKLKSICKQSLLFIAEKKIIQYILITCILLLPVAYVVNNKFFKDNKKELTHQSLNVEKDINGNIKTDIEDGIEEEQEMSSYTLGNSYSKNESANKTNNTSSNSTASSSSSVSTNKADKSSLKGESISILEGSSFEPLKDLKIKATDKDGSNISNRVVVESNNVNTNKPGNYEVKASVRLSDGYLIHKTFKVNVKATKLDVSITKFKSKKQIVDKNDSIVLELEVKSSKSYVTPISAMINGQQYTLYKSNEGIFSNLLNKNKYKVHINTGDIAGIKKYKLSHIKMSDGTLIDIEKTATVEVLKTEAKIKNFDYEVDSVNKLICTKFNVEDDDNTVSNLKLELYKDKEVVYKEDLDRKTNYNINIPVDSKGTYEIKIMADISLSSDKDYITAGKELLIESINIKKIDETSLSGNDIELTVGDTFDIVDLNLKATDVDGEDITNNIVVNIDSVKADVPGEYIVSAYVVNKENKKFTAEFKVTVKDNIIVQEETSEDEDSIMSNFARLFNINNKKTSSVSSISRNTSNNTVISGNDKQTLTSNVDVTGIVSKSDGSAPQGNLHVEVPTKLSFTVNENGLLIGSTYTINNKSSVPISVYVSQFEKIGSNDGIIVRPLSDSLSNEDRSNINLYLNGDKQVDLGQTITTDEHLVDVSKSSSRTVTLLGNAGNKSNEELDKKGVSNEFKLIFKIKKKN